MEEWQKVCAGPAHEKFTGDCGELFRVSRPLLHAHEDKVFCGAIVASMSNPWGEIKGDGDIGGYHLVWPRDLMQSCTGLLAAGHTDAPARALIWLACLQRKNGEFPQNAWISGEAFWTGLQLDQVAAPVILAWRVREAKALADFDPWYMISSAAGYLVTHGPVTMQERWEESAGYSPATLASSVAALVIVAEFARERNDETSAQFALDYADWLASHLEDWTVTTQGELVKGIPRHFVRITPGNPNDPHTKAHPNSAVLKIGNGGGDHPARNVVSLEFLQLVRLGIMDPHDPVIADSVKVIDAVLKHDLPQGLSWQRYNHDGYGQHDDGSAFNGTGTGGCWPLLTGERGHYELVAGRDPRPYIVAMEGFANAGHMLPEQLWWQDDISEFKKGDPAGSAMPLCWAHAEYMTLVRSFADGKAFDAIAPVQSRYAAGGRTSRYEMWTLAHRIDSIVPGKIVRVITDVPATIYWNTDQNEFTTRETDLGCWFADLPTEGLMPGSEIRFTLSCDAKGEEHVVKVSTVE